MQIYRLFILVLLSMIPSGLLADDKPVTRELPFTSHDGYNFFGKLVLPQTSVRAIVVYVQTAEGATVDMKRRKSATETFNYYDLYRTKFPPMGVGFFSYEGRGCTMGDKPPRFETIDRKIYNTSSLDNKVRDALSAIAVLRQQPGLAKMPIYLMGSSESTLLAAEAAYRAPREVSGLLLYSVLATNMRQNFRFIMTDGAFLPFKVQFDTDGDGKVSKAEYEADPKQFRARAGMKTTAFENLDADKDGFFTVKDLLKLRTQKYVDAIDQEDFAVLQEWAKTSAAVAVPDNWFKDHFAHQPIWTFLSKLEIPVAIFHGAMDVNTPIEAVKKLEDNARLAGKRNISFYYFDKLDHSLGIAAYFMKGTLPEGHSRIFEWMNHQIK